MDFPGILQTFLGNGFTLPVNREESVASGRIWFQRDSPAPRSFSLYLKDGVWRFRCWQYVPGPGDDDVDCPGGSLETAARLASEYFFGQPTLVEGWLMPFHQHPDWNRNAVWEAVRRAGRLSANQWKEFDQRLLELFRERDAAHMARLHRGVPSELNAQDLIYQPIAHSHRMDIRLWLRRDIQHACIVASY